MAGRELRSYAFPGAGVTVAFETGGIDDWLDEVLRPAFTPVSEDPDLVTVVVRANDTHATGGTPIGEVVCFVFDGMRVAHPAWRRGETIEVVDDKYHARYRIGPTTVDLDLHGPVPGSRSAVLRVVRELVFAQSLADPDRTLMHASAVEHAGRVVLFAGAKEAGKTTLVARLASATPAHFVGNDCVLVSPADIHESSWTVRAVPLPVSVRPGTLARLPDLFRTIPAVERPSRLSVAEAAATVARSGTFDHATRMMLSPPQFAQALGTELSSGGTLARIAFVQIDDGVRDFVIEPLTPSDAGTIVASAVYGPRGSTAGVTVFEQFLGTHRPLSADAAVSARIAADVPAVSLRVGPLVLDDDDVVRAMLTELMVGA